MRVPYMAGALLTAALITGCQTSTAADEEAIRELDRLWIASSNGRDAAALAGIYAEDGLRMNANEASLQGRAAIRARFEEEWADGTVGTDGLSVIRDIEVSGDLAAARGTWTGTTIPTEGDPFSDSGDWISVYRRQDDGSWKIIWEMWTTELPPRPRG